LADLNLLMPEYKRHQVPTQPLGLYFIKAYLESIGYRVNVTDANLKRTIFGNEVIIGVYVTTFLYKQAAGIIKAAKERGKIVVCGGPHTYSDSQSLLDIGADICVVGDGELAMENIMRHFDKFSTVDGLPKIMQGTPVDLDTLPLPEHARYPNVASVSISTSRGCPFRCIFCTRFMGSRWRAMSAGRVLEWLSRHDGKDIIVNDDNFTFNAKRVHEVAEGVRKEKLAVGFVFGNGIRMHTATDEMLKTLKRMNTIKLAYGVESVHDSILTLACKGQTRNLIERVVQKTQAAMIPFDTFMIIGLPGDTLQKSVTAYKWTKERRLNVYWNIAVPYPHTPLFDWVSRHGRWLINPKDYTQYGGHISSQKVIFDTEDYPAKSRLDFLKFCQFGKVKGPRDITAIKMSLSGSRGYDTLRAVYKRVRSSASLPQPFRRILFGLTEQDFIDGRVPLGDEGAN